MSSWKGGNDLIEGNRLSIPYLHLAGVEQQPLLTPQAAPPGSATALTCIALLAA